MVLYQAILGVISCLFCLDLVASKGYRASRVRAPPKEQKITYPSQQRIYPYYTYYMRYFTMSSIRYAKLHQNSTTVTICKNMEPNPLNGSVLGLFPCPMKLDEADFTYCCGESNYQYCCRAIDTLPVRLAIGLSSALVLGILTGIIICLIIRVKSQKRAWEMKKNHQTKMAQLGIPKYEEVKTEHYSASQAEDGYQITVKFNNNCKFYKQFWKVVQQRYENIGWKYSNGSQKKEGKIVLEDGTWIGITLLDEYHGRPYLLVSREKAAVYWMTNDFIDICNRIPGETGLCSCFSRSRRRVKPEAIHGKGPEVAPTSAAYNKYELSHDREDSAEPGPSNPEY